MISSGGGSSISPIDWLFSFSGILTGVFDKQTAVVDIIIESSSGNEVSDDFIIISTTIFLSLSLAALSKLPTLIGT